MMAKSEPERTADAAEYWEGCRRHELLIQRCENCGIHQFYPRLLCGSCSGRSLAWVRASGRGTIKSFTIVRRAVSDAYAADVPYVVALVTLEEGPTMMSNVVGCGVEQLHIGMPLEVVFEDWSDSVSIAKFKPV
jgi:uncharacterized OB-fold protein